MAPRGQDGATGASAHAQAEAMGLGPTTVVRLERALAHEVLRYCTATRRSARKMLRVQGGTGPLFGGVERTRLHETMIGRNRRPRPRTTPWGLHGQTPSTQAWFKVREWVGHGQTRVRCHLLAVLPSADASGENVLCWSGSVSPARRHAERDLLFLVSTLGSLTSPGCCKGGNLHTVHGSPVIHIVLHNLWITVWMESVGCSGATRNRATGPRQREFRVHQS
jgi:hypothetical protein